MKWLVTGGLGYIGSHLVTKLVEDPKNEIHILDNLSHGRSIESLANVQTIIADITDSGVIQKILERERYGGIFHLAALKSVEEAQIQKEQYRLTNVEGTRNLINAAEATHVQHFIFTSTCAVYGEPIVSKEIGIDESFDLTPINYYGLTKKQAEEIIVNSSKMNYCILRFFNVIGSKSIELLNIEDSSLLSNLIATQRSGEYFKLFGTDYPTKDGTCERDFIDVMDIVEALNLVSIKMAEGNLLNKIYNLGTNSSTSVRQFAELFFDALGVPPRISGYPRRDGDVSIVMANSRLISQELGFKPGIDVKSSIREVCDLLKNQALS
jgi:UDP-glucose 4-epimerase